MIHFRFHIVSLIAVFLALALGIIMGSAVVNRGLVDQLSRQVDRVKRHDDQVQAANDQLARDRDAANGFVDQTAPYVVQHRLDGVTLGIVAVRGTDGGAVRSTVDLLRAAGARVPAVVWLEPAWNLTDRTAVDKLATALGTPPAFSTAPTSTVTTARGATTTLPAAVDQLRRDGLTALANRLTAGSRRTSDALAALQSGGFVALDGAGNAVPDTPSWPVASRLVLLGGDDPSHLADAVVAPTVNAFVSTGAGIVVGEVFKPVAKLARGIVVDGIRRDTTLAARVATVDDVDVVSGRVAVVLSLTEVGRGVVGHYGIARGAKRQVPPLTATP